MPDLDLDAIEHRSDRFLARLAGNQEGSTSLAAQMSAMDVPDLLAAAKDLRATPNRPHRLACETGDEKRLHTTDGKVHVYRQIGWHGQTGAFYALGEDPSKSEPGSFSPLWICVDVEILDPEEPGGDVPVESAPAAEAGDPSARRCVKCEGLWPYHKLGCDVVAGHHPEVGAASVASADTTTGDPNG